MKKVSFFLISALLFVTMSCDKEDASLGSDDFSELKSGRKVLTFSAHLTGDQEVAVPPVITEATGQALFQLSKDGEELSFKVIVDGIENITMAHIHVGPAGQNGPVVLWLYPAASPAQLIPGPFEGILTQDTKTSANLVGELAGKEMSDLVDLMLAGKTYVNVHTSQYPAGEIRGQIRLNGPKNK
jgi:hypothetical protein